MVQDALQQPVMLLLTQESARRGLKLQKPSDKSAKCEELSAFDMSQFVDAKRLNYLSHCFNLKMNFCIFNVISAAQGCMVL